MSEPLVVLGAGGFGREVLDVLTALAAAGPAPHWQLRGVVDDTPRPRDLERLAARGVPWLGSQAEVLAGVPGHFVCAIGAPQVRHALTQRWLSSHWRAATLVHPAATLGTGLRIGAGCVICGGVQISTNVRLGDHVHVNPNATLGHDAELGDCVSVNPGAIISGEVCLDDDVLIGAGAVVLQGLRVGAGAVVGAAACLTRDVVTGHVVKGVPAR